MDFFQKISDSLKFTFKYKSLWVLGFVLSLFGVGTRLNFSLNTTGTDKGTLNDFLATYNTSFSQVRDALNNSTGLLLIAVLAVISVLIGILVWYISATARASLVKAVMHHKQKEEVSLTREWAEGTHFAMRLIGLDILVALTTLVILLPAILLLIISAALPVLLCITIPLFVVYLIVIAIGVALTQTGAERYLVIKDAGIIASLKTGAHLAQKHLADYIIGFLVSLLPGCLWTIVLFVVALILLVPGAIISAAAFQSHPWIFIGTTAIGAMLAGLITALINSPYVVFTNAYWTEIVMEFISKE